jgi:hypothetical protein
VQILIGVIQDLPESNPPINQSSELLIIKFLGYSLIALLVISGILAALNSEHLSIFSHLATVIIGALAVSLKARYNPPT